MDLILILKELQRLIDTSGFHCWIIVDFPFGVRGLWVVKPQTHNLQLYIKCSYFAVVHKEFTNLNLRNTRVIDINKELNQFVLDVDIHDPWSDPEEVKYEYILGIKTKPNGGTYQAIIIAGSHNEFKSIDFNAIKATGDIVVFDTKGFLDRVVVGGRL